VLLKEDNGIIPIKQLFTNLEIYISVKLKPKKLMFYEIIKRR